MTREMGSLGKDVAAGSPRRPGRRSSTTRSSSRSRTRCGLRKSHVERFLDGQVGPVGEAHHRQTSLSIFTADETFRFLRDGSTGVIRGWGAVHLLRDVPHVIRVRVCAPLETRVARMMERLAHRQPRHGRERDPDERGSPHRHHQAPLRRELARSRALRPGAFAPSACRSTSASTRSTCMMKHEVLPGNAGFVRMVDNLALGMERALGAAPRRAHHRHAHHGRMRRRRGDAARCRGHAERVRGRGRGRRGAVEGVKRVDNQLKAATPPAPDSDARGEWARGSS